MPSSHAQFAAYFSAYLSLFLLLRHQPQPGRTPTPWPLGMRAALALAAGAGATVVAASRVYLGYHTAAQAAAGSVAGAFAAVVWFGVTAWVRASGLLQAVVDSALARALRIRDLLPEEDLADAGWVRWQTLRRRKAE